MTKPLDIRWYHKCFDSNWVRCDNCRTEYPIRKVERKNKCPKCKLDNHHCIKK